MKTKTIILINGKYGICNSQYDITASTIGSTWSFVHDGSLSDYAEGYAATIKAARDGLRDLIASMLKERGIRYHYRDGDGDIATDQHSGSWVFLETVKTWDEEVES